jgi:hypothetical protein
MSLKRGFATVVVSALAALPAWAGYAYVFDAPRSAAALAPVVAGELEYEVRSTAEVRPIRVVADPHGFEAWALSRHRAARESLARRPPGPTCAVLSGSTDGAR